MEYQGAMYQPRIPATIKIAQLITQVTGTYNPVYSRPYVTNVDQQSLDVLNTRLEQHAYGPIESNVFQGMGTMILQPAVAHQGELPIPYGWAERRVRFVMEVHVTLPTGSLMIYYFQGYTSHDGISPVSGAIDPQMEFVINSFVRVTRNSVYHPQLGTQVVDRISESAHVINGRIVQNTTGGEIYTMRPTDIFTGIQSGYLRDSYEAYSPAATYDDRRFKSVGDPVRSNRSNNLSANFLAKVVDCHKTGMEMLEFGQDQANQLQRAASMCYEETLVENPVLRALANIKGVTNTVSFTSGDLLKLDPNVMSVTNAIRLAPTQAAKLHTAGATSYWNGADMETMVATMLSNGIPALMMENLITKVHFRSTNYDSMGRMNTVFVDAKSLTNTDISPNIDLFRRRLESELLYDITYGNQELYQLEAIIDLFGETRLSISIGGKAVTEYATPSFCDSLMAPVITTNRSNFDTVVHDMEALMNNLTTQRGGGMNGQVNMAM